MPKQTDASATPEASAQVTAAEISRLAGVTRATVSNWRRRHADFPSPAGGTDSSPLYDLAQVRDWLAGRGREKTPPLEELRTLLRLSAHAREAAARLLPFVLAERRRPDLFNAADALRDSDVAARAQALVRELPRHPRRTSTTRCTQRRTHPCSARFSIASTPVRLRVPSTCWRSASWRTRRPAARTPHRARWPNSWHDCWLPPAHHLAIQYVSSTPLAAAARSSPPPPGRARGSCSGRTSSPSRPTQPSIWRIDPRTRGRHPCGGQPARRRLPRPHRGRVRCATRRSATVTGVMTSWPTTRAGRTGSRHASSPSWRGCSTRSPT